MIKFLLITLSVTSLSWARGYNDYESPYSSYSGDYYTSYDYPSSSQPSKAEILKKKMTVLNELREQSIRNARSCNNRQECLSLDQESLQNIQGKYGKYFYLQEFFSELNHKLNQAIESDTVVTELVVYHSLSDTARKQYLEGIRINDPQKVAADLIYRYSAGQHPRQAVPAVKFNIDDLKIYVLQQIEKNHQGCRERESCAQSDIRSITEVANILKRNDPDRSNLEQLIDSIQEEAFRQPFNTVLFYESYYATLTQQQPFLYKSQEQTEWNKLVKNMRLTHRRDPQILNHKEVKEESRVETQMKRKLEKQGEDLVGSILGQLNNDGNNQGHGGLLGALLGGK